ncbi:retrovirus-related pol polyprotein from transposon TNT 1-94 [Tanacetum coccineum]
MADMNIPANDASAEQAPAIAPPTRTDDQILPLSKWVPIGKSNCVLDVQKAFTASSTIPAIYIQQFWDTMCFNSSTGLYSCQLDEQWFNLHKDILIDALGITLTNDNNPFLAPPSSDTVIKYVNTLGYPSTLRNVSVMSVNSLYQPWRAILSMINMCLTGKTVGYDRPRHLVLQILWGIIHRSNIDYAERIWEEFVQSIQTFLTDRKNLTTASRGKKKTAHLLIPSVRFTKLIIHHLKTKHNIHPRTGSPLHYSHDENVLNTLRFVGKDGREIFGIPILDALLTDDIKGAPRYDEYLEHVAKYQQHLDAAHGMEDEGGATDSPKATKVTKPKAAKVTKPAGDKAPKPTSSQPSKPTPAQTEPSKKDQGKKHKLLVDEFVDEGVLEKEPAHDDEETDLQRALELSLKDQGEQTQGPACLVVIRETDYGRNQSLPDVQGKGKEKVVDEQAVYDLLTLQTPKQKSHADQFIFQRRTPMPTESSGHAESPSLDAELALIDSEMESDEEAPEIHAGDQDEGQARPNPGEQDEGQAGPNPVEQDEGQAGSNPGDAAEEERLDKQRTQLYNLENLNIPHKVNQAVDEIVTDAVDWVIQAPLRARFRDLPIKSLELDYPNQRLAYQEEARKKRRQRRDVPRTPSGSPHSQPPPPPPPAGASGAPSTSGASGYESFGVSRAQELSLTDSLMQDDSIPDEQVHLSDDEDSENDHLPKADSRKDWWKPLPEEERPATPEPILGLFFFQNVSVDFEGHAYEVVKSFYPDVIHLQFQMEECHKMLTDQVDWTNPEGDQVRFDVKRSLPLGGLPSHETIQIHLFFNKEFEYLRYGSKGSSTALSISKIKAVGYPDFGLELLVPEQMCIKDEGTYDISSKYGISHWWLST